MSPDAEISVPDAMGEPVGLNPRLHVVLVEPEIAGNAGAVGRTCVALGADLWLVRPFGFHLDDRRRRRAGLDYWDHLRLHIVDDLGEAIQQSGAPRAWFFSTHASRLLHQAEFGPGDALVFGSESRGLPSSLLTANPDQAIRMPMAPQARSLNLSCAVSVGLYEASRQLGFEYAR